MNCSTPPPEKINIIQNIFSTCRKDLNLTIVDIGGTSSYYSILDSIFNSKNFYILNSCIKVLANKSICGDANHLPFKDHSIDILLSLDLLEHLVSPDEFLSESFRVLKNQGILIISTPNLSDFFSRITFLFGFTPYSYNPSKYRVAVPFSKLESNMGHKSVFTYKGLEELLLIYKFSKIQSYGYSYADSFYLDLSPEIRKRQAGFFKLRKCINCLLPKSMCEGMLVMYIKKE